MRLVGIKVELGVPGQDDPLRCQTVRLTEKSAGIPVSNCPSGPFGKHSASVGLGDTVGVSPERVTLNFDDCVVGININ
jgi:hypothetical protein